MLARRFRFAIADQRVDDEPKDGEPKDSKCDGSLSICSLIARHPVRHTVSTQSVIV